MQCTKCGGEVPNEAKFCMHCGQQIATTTHPCPWCHSNVSTEAAFCTSCGQSMAALVIPTKDVFDLRGLFRKGGCPTEVSREVARSMNFLKGEEIIAALPKGRGGMIGVFDRGNNSFADLSINGLIKHHGPFSTIITNNHLFFVEPAMVIAFEDLRAYELEGRVIQGRPKLTLGLDNREVTCLLSLTTGTGPVGSYFSLMNSMSDVFDSSDETGRAARENSSKAFAFLEAVGELFATIGAIWERRSS